eukprot:comp8025_c0_seq1/m.3528 comp8025_c0_seq1/g.3528  ORF comp8025_c0_seq1/g.3528 comp8025_c0_seq1/m.3528 type:complete len:223 (-) comp8025_c0_seq1:28-696(-)
MVEANTMQISKPAAEQTELEQPEVEHMTAPVSQVSVDVPPGASHVADMHTHYTTKAQEQYVHVEEEGPLMTFKTKLIYFVLMALGMCSWVVGIGGISATTQTCNSLTAPNYSCNNQIRLIWMSFWFFVVMVLVTGAMVFVDSIPRARNLILVLWAMCTVFTMLSADYALSLQGEAYTLVSNQDGKELYERSAVTYSGAILMSIIGFVMVIAVGGLDRTTICR